jgi:GT2 family glycosyltransferase
MVPDTQNTKENSDPLVTISIVSHGDSKKVIRLLGSIQTHERTKLIQVIITDNLGFEIPVIDSSPWSSLVILRNEHPRGFARNHNQAFQLASTRYFCVLNPDVIFREEVFISLLRFLENDQTEIVAPLIKDTNNFFQDSYRDFPKPFEVIRRRLPNYRFIPPPSDASGLVRPDWIAGIFMFMKSETFKGLNGFDERYRLYFEDVDFCARAKLAGLRILVDTKIHVQHDANRASRKNLLYLLWHIRSAIRFFSSPVYKKTIQKIK